MLEEALRANVQRVVYTSSVAAIGPAPRGTVADETQLFRGGYGLSYMDSKHEAEVQALRLAARGLPVVIVNPAFVFGAGDINHSSTELVRRCLRRELPAYVDGALNVVDVKDVARGHLLADEKGTVGERYILGNRNFTFDRLLADIGRISGVEPPAIKMPLPLALALARVTEDFPGRAPVTAGEVRAASLWWTYSNAKAKRELGYKPSHHEDTLSETIAWYRANEDRLAAPGARQAIPLRMLGFGFRRRTRRPGRRRALRCTLGLLFLPTATTERGRGRGRLCPSSTPPATVDLAQAILDRQPRRRLRHR